MSKLNSNDRDILDNFKGMSVGQIFNKSRTSQKLDIEQIAAYLNIGTSHLEAIEADDKNSLPPQVYAVGFVRAYADVLGLDSEKMAYLFKIQSYGVKKTEEQKAITTRRQGETVPAKAIFYQLLSLRLLGLCLSE
jgi:cytoskeleton protein RodZ